MFAREAMPQEDVATQLQTDILTALSEGTIDQASHAFELASLATKMEHPLCAECARIVADRIQKQIKDETAIREAYAAYLRQAVAEDTLPTDEAAVQRDIEAMQEEEAALRAELEALQSGQEALQLSLATLEEDESQLAEMEAAYWADYSAFIAQLDQFLVERDAVKRAYETADESLRMLKATNVLNDAFHIWHEGPMGTINSYRLGRLPSIAVSWEEINAAWGQTALLVATLARKCRFEFTEWIIVPIGSNTRIHKKEKGGRSSSGFELFGSETSIGKKLLGGNRSFDKAMVAFLACVRELAMEVRRRRPTLSLPYAIEDARIGPVDGEMLSIRVSSWEPWTRACKFLLTDIKWILSAVSAEDR
eukprot:c8659_g1_i1.p1 GENE.c8659_g1_i1~~c8659_g1_i1.p1  ORF type:complete len:429 (+),score=101.57 c8659_g1_i1:193-1287(+)